jgi:glycosyltransferase involved in cell wall biosynthesis
MEDTTIISRGARVRERPKVSVIMPAYNTAQFIVEALESVFTQTYADFEAIVVNDGSPDTVQMEEAIAPYRDRIVYIRQKNTRAAGARNTGIRHARGEFLAFLDSDDSLTPGALAVQMGKFAEDPSLDMIYGNALQFESVVGSGKRYMEVCPSIGAVTFSSMVKEDTQVCIVGAVVRKEVIEKAGLFDESLKRCDDYDMWVRIAHAGGRIAYHQTVVGNSRVGRPGSLGASELGMLEAAMEILSTLDKKVALSDEQKALVIRRVAFHKAHHDRVMTRVYLDRGDYQNATASLSRANSYFKSAKLGLVLLFMRRSPKLVRMISSVGNPR